MDLFGIFFLVSTFAATGYSLSCTVCTSDSTTSCTGSNITCPSGSLCGSIYTTTAGKYILFLDLSLPHLIIKAFIKVIVSTTNSTSNGLVCRTCATADSTWCYTSDTMTCTGNENMCILQTTKISVGSQSASAALRGCATKSMCDIGSQSQSAGGASTEVKFICTSGSFGLHSSFSILAIVCLFCLQLLC
ncbi:uncharacterized protein PAF06_016579 [Gastrophryne carolinensis]